MIEMQYKYFDEGKAHLHTLGGNPLIGTSTVVGILNKPLTWWAAGMALKELGWTNGNYKSKDFIPREEGIKIAAKARRFFFINNEQYYDWLQECYRAHDEKKKDSAEAGTDMHAELEKYVIECLENGGKPIVSDKAEMWQVDIFAKWAIANVEQFLFAEGHTYSKIHWVGGITDAGAKMKNGKMAVIDFKSSDRAYYAHFVQGGGYALQIEENGIVDAKGARVLAPFLVEELTIIPFRDKKLAPRTIQNVQGFKDAFLGALLNYKLNQAFNK